MLQTPLHDFHVSSGGKMVEFAGWEMPVMYDSIIAEHNHCRNYVAAFDVSHMGRLEFHGADAERFLQKLCTRNLAGMVVGQCRYGHVCREDGGMLDDVIVSRFDGYWGMVCNASNREKLLGWFDQHRAGYDVTVKDVTMQTAMLAVQGPEAVPLLSKILPVDLAGTKRYHFKTGEVQGAQFIVYRSGYTGEDGAEIVFPAELAPIVAPLFLAKAEELKMPVKMAGLGARDSLRLEAGMPLYGHELTEDWDSLTAGQKWCVDLTKDFIGAEAMRAIAANPTRALIGLELEGRRAARQGMKILRDGKEVGFVTSGALTPTVNKSIAMGLVEIGASPVGTRLEIDLRGTNQPATVVSLPFYKRAK
jgi:aminomethyltransferase